MQQSIMRLYCSRIKKKDSQVILHYGPPLRSLAAVDILKDCPKFSGIDSLEGKNQVIYSSHEIENQFTPKKVIQKPKHISCSTNRWKNSPKTIATVNGLSQIVNTMRVKNIVKERKLRLRFITNLSESGMKTKLLLEFLTSGAENESAKDKCAVAVTEEKQRTSCSLKYSIHILDWMWNKRFLWVVLFTKL